MFCWQQQPSLVAVLLQIKTARQINLHIPPGNTPSTIAFQLHNAGTVSAGNIIQVIYWICGKCHFGTKFDWLCHTIATATHCISMPLISEKKLLRGFFTGCKCRSHIAMKWNEEFDKDVGNWYLKYFLSKKERLWFSIISFSWEESLFLKYAEEMIWFHRYVETNTSERFFSGFN